MSIIWKTFFLFGLSINLLAAADSRKNVLKTIFIVALSITILTYTFCLIQNYSCPIYFYFEGDERVEPSKLGKLHRVLLRRPAIVGRHGVPVRRCLDRRRHGDVDEWKPDCRSLQRSKKIVAHNYSHQASWTLIYILSFCN